MSEAYGKFAFRERRKEFDALRCMRGATGNDRRKNNGLPTGWMVKDDKGQDAWIAAEFIGNITIIRQCAKSMKPSIDFSTITNLTEPDAVRFFAYYPEWLRENSSKSALFKRLDDTGLQEMIDTTEVELGYRIMLNKYEIKDRTGEETFSDPDMFRFVWNILVENFIMKAGARGANSVVSTRIASLLKKYIDNDDIPDDQLRPLLRVELTQLEAKLHLEFPDEIHKALTESFDKLLTQDKHGFMEDEGEDDDTEN